MSKVKGGGNTLAQVPFEPKPRTKLTPASLNYQQPVAELTLAPSGDEILLVRSQELVDQFLSCENKLTKFLMFHWAWSLIGPTLKLIK